MSTILGTYVQTGLSSHVRINAIVDVMLAPNLLEFRQITIYHEAGTRLVGNTFKFTYQHWNPDFPIEVYLNDSPTPLPTNQFTVNYDMGLITTTFDPVAGDHLLCTYNFDYFPISFLEGFAIKAIDVINTGGGPVTNNTIDDAPTNWDSIICDLMISMCMEKLILDYDLWKGRLVFAIGPANAADGGGDIVSQLTTIKQNTEERAYKSIENPKLKCSPYLAQPTATYYNSLFVGGAMVEKGGAWYGKLRGLKNNKYLGGSF